MVRRLLLAMALLGGVTAAAVTASGPMEVSACTLFRNCEEGCDSGEDCKLHEKCEEGSCEATVRDVNCEDIVS